jgi:stage IV sporulation protein FB
MLLGSPDHTAYDLRFRVLGIPVRVHPLFWLVMVLISGQSKDLKAAAVFVGCAFISVLIHELGHGLSSRVVGNEPVGIVLYAMGGYCQFMPRAQTPGQRLFVLLMGPGAGFALLGLVLAYARARYAVEPADALWLAGVGPRVLAALGLKPEDPLAAGQSLGLFQHHPSLAGQAIYFFIIINLWWGILNLIPIWPLDGGQAAGVVLGRVNPRHGTRWMHVVSLLTAGGVAVWWASADQFMTAIWFGYFAFINYQILQSIHASDRFGDDPEWWGR